MMSYEQNREQIAAKQHAYYEQNREQIAAKQHAYREQIAAKQMTEAEGACPWCAIGDHAGCAHNGCTCCGNAA